MKKTSIIIILAACAWSLSACTNRNNVDHENDNFRDTLDQDTLPSPPVDTTERLDTTTLDGDTA